MQVVLREGESFEALVKRFKAGVEREGILRDFKRKRRFKPAHEVRREKIQAAMRRRRRANRSR